MREVRAWRCPRRAQADPQVHAGSQGSLPGGGDGEGVLHTEGVKLDWVQGQWVARGQGPYLPRVIQYPPSGGAQELGIEGQGESVLTVWVWPAL